MSISTPTNTTVTDKKLWQDGYAVFWMKLFRINPWLVKVNWGRIYKVNKTVIFTHRARTIVSVQVLNHHSKDRILTGSTVKLKIW